MIVIQHNCHSWDCADGCMLQKVQAGQSGLFPINAKIYLHLAHVSYVPDLFITAGNPSLRLRATQ